METSSFLCSSSSKSHFAFSLGNAPPFPKASRSVKFNTTHLPTSVPNAICCTSIFVGSPHSSLLSRSFAVAEAMEQASVTSPSQRVVFSKVDKSGRFCSPRAAREHALMILYAACLEGSDPVRLFDKRVNTRYPNVGFDKDALLKYDHMRFGGPPISAESEEEVKELVLIDEEESANEAEVLSAPPKLVYSKYILSLTRQILVAVVERWDQHIIAMNKISPSSWKDEPAGKILELCILHLAMAEITIIGTRHQIVINEAVDLAKRFCDGSAPRIINGCLRTFIQDHTAVELARALEAKS